MTDRKPDAPLPNPLVDNHSPIWQELFFEIFFKPRKFFSDLSILMQRRYVVAVTLVCGCAQAIDRIDQELVKVMLREDAPRSEFIQLITDNWLYYWGAVLGYGAIGALFLWWIGGWWYRVRLQWSGAVEPDPRLARVVYIYASFVLAAPTVIASLIYMGFYDSYTQAFNSEEIYSLVLVIFPFWSLITSYIGIRVHFEVSRWRARTWFIILPALLYLLVFGGFAWLFLMLGSAA